MMGTLDAKDMKIQRLCDEIAKQKLLIKSYELDVQLYRDTHNRNLKTLMYVAAPTLFSLGAVFGYLIKLIRLWG